MGQKAEGSVRCRGTTEGLLGVAARYNNGKTILRMGQFATSRAELARRLRVEARQRRQRKLRVSLRWVQKKGRDIAMEMPSEGCVFKYDRLLPACSDKWAWTWLTVSGFRYRRGKCKRRTPIPVMARWWSVVREFAGQGFVAAERVDGHQLVTPVDSERVHAIGERCLSRPRAHRLVGQCDASARFRRDPENEETAFCAIVRAEEHDGALATLGRWRCEQHLQGLAAGHHGAVA